MVYQQITTSMVNQSSNKTLNRKGYYQEPQDDENHYQNNKD